MPQSAHMTTSDQPNELYPISHSTAYIFLAALITIRNNEDDHYDDNAVDYATKILLISQHQPETVLNLEAYELEDIGPVLLDNAHTGLT